MFVYSRIKRSIDDILNSCPIDFYDFFFEYCKQKGYEDPEENEHLTEEMYDKLEDEVVRRLTGEVLHNLYRKIYKATNEIISTEVSEWIKEKK